MFIITYKFYIINKVRKNNVKKLNIKLLKK